MSCVKTFLVLPIKANVDFTFLSVSQLSDDCGLFLYLVEGTLGQGEFARERIPGTTERYCFTVTVDTI